jgi:transcriptional regulator with XRE-family HTH domain
MARDVGTRAPADASPDDDGVSPAPATPVTPAASPPQSEGQRQLRALTHSAGELAERIGVSRQTVNYWRTGQKTPGPEMRAAIERATAIPAQSWERTPVDRPSPRPAKAPLPSAPLPPVTLSGRPSTLDEVTQLLGDLDADAEGDILPSELARIRDTKTKALALKARIEAQDALFEAAAITKHASWKRLRATMLDALRPFPDAARAVADALQQANA